MGLPTPKVCEATKMVRAIVRKRGADEVARKTKAHPDTVRGWVDGRRRANADARLAFLEHYAIPLAAWDLPAVEEPPKLNGHASVKVTDPVKMTSAKEVAVEQVHRHRTRLARLEHEKAPLSDILAQEGKLTVANRQLAQLAGELEITEATLIKTPAWARLMRRIAPVLEEHPEVAKEIAKVLEEIEPES